MTKADPIKPKPPRPKPAKKEPALPKKPKGGWDWGGGSAQDGGSWS